MTRSTGFGLYRERLGLPGAVAVAATLLLCAVGVVVAASIDDATDGAGGSTVKHLARIAVALPACAIVLAGRPGWIRSQAYAFYGVVAALLVLVLVAGPVVNGARRWIGPNAWRFQPSELAKLALCLTLARYLALRSRAATFRGVLAASVLTGIPAVLIAKEPDLGTALILVPVLFGTLFVAGARPRHLALVAAAGILLFGLYATFFLHGYQSDRIRVWWRQDSLTRGEKLAEGYHLHRSKIAIGSGGVLGHGFGEGPQNRLDLLPERHTDFVFSVFCEEFGFAGGAAVLFLEVLVPLSLLGLAVRVRDPFARNAIVAIGIQLGSQAIVNMGVATGTLPTTGIALPLVSYGGTSLIVTLVSIAIALQFAAKAEPELAADAFEAAEEETSLARAP